MKKPKKNREEIKDRTLLIFRLLKERSISDNEAKLFLEDKIGYQYYPYYQPQYQSPFTITSTNTDTATNTASFTASDTDESIINNKGTYGVI